MFGRNCAGSPGRACFAQRPEPLNSLRGDFQRLFSGVVVHGGHSSWFSVKNLSLSQLTPSRRVLLEVLLICILFTCN